MYSLTAVHSEIFSSAYCSKSNANKIIILHDDATKHQNNKENENTAHRVRKQSTGAESYSISMNENEYFEFFADSSKYIKISCA